MAESNKGRERPAETWWTGRPFPGEFGAAMARTAFPAFDLEGVADYQRKNFDAVAAANRKIMDSSWKATMRQAEVVAETWNGAWDTLRDMASVGSPEKAAAKQSAYLEETFGKMVGCAREVSEDMAESAVEAASLVNERVVGSLDELKDLAKPRAN
ncbi:MAG: phasin family protein [Rhodospirillales bacterium]|nr:phasin family protein [Rhodospirillales bacterium]MDP6805449.1 phasin family protein [Rhodospirillales bacterium]